MSLDHDAQKPPLLHANEIEVQFVVGQPLVRLRPIMPLELQFQREETPIKFRIADVGEANLNLESAVAGHTTRLHFVQLVVQFPGSAPFLRREVGLLAKEKAFEPFQRRMLRSESIFFALAACNHFLDCYRVSYNDAFVRPIGFLDVLSGVHISRWGSKDIPESRYIFSGHEMFLSSLYPRNPEVERRALHQLKQAINEGPRFLDICVMELEKSRAQGQNRETVIWSATTIDVLVDNYLISQLEKSSEFDGDEASFRKKLESSQSYKKRNKLFVAVCGVTLKQRLGEIVISTPHVRADSVWHRIPEDVDRVFKLRNDLIHRQSSIDSRGAAHAYSVCMNVVGALSNGLPFDGLVHPQF